MKLTAQQAALILESSDEGEISVDVVSGKESGLATALCHAIATKLLSDEQFQVELQAILDEQDQ